MKCFFLPPRCMIYNHSSSFQDNYFLLRKTVTRGFFKPCTRNSWSTKCLVWWSLRKNAQIIKYSYFDINTALSYSACPKPTSSVMVFSCQVNLDRIFWISPLNAGQSFDLCVVSYLIPILGVRIEYQAVSDLIQTKWFLNYREILNLISILSKISPRKQHNFFMWRKLQE